MIDFDENMRVIFDGQKFAVGREAYDMTIVDLDGDQVFEIGVPISAFYGFEKSRLSSMETPLPGIVFKYDGEQQKYLPANVLLKDCLIKEIEAAEGKLRSQNRQEVRLGDVMSIVLDYVFVGEDKRAWKFFEETCILPDKAQIRSDMQEMLNDHPVYRYLFGRRSSG